MFCYRDRRFCQFYEECKDGSTCPKAYTKQVQKDALNWWHTIKPNDNIPPVDLGIDKPDCFIRKD